MTDDSLPVVDPGQLEGSRTDASVHGTLLAGGTSSRYGEANKLLATRNGAALVRHAAATLVDSRVTDVTVVLGHEGDRVRRALEGLPVECRDNPAYDAGQSSSVRTAVAAARAAAADAVLVALGDMPSVDPGTVDLLVDAYERGTGSVIVAGYEGRRGNPVLFDARHFDALAAASGDIGGRKVLLEADDTVVLETGDPGVHEDVDHPIDLDG